MAFLNGGDMGAVTEVKVPDIGDFKDIPIIEVMVKPGDPVKAGRSARLARIGQGDDGRAGTRRGDREGAQGQGRRQGERRQRHPAARLRRGASSGGAATAAPKTRGVGTAVADERARRRRRSARAGHRRFQGRAGDRGAGEAGRHGEGGRSRWSRSNRTRRRWTCRRRSAAWCRTIKVKVGDKVSEGAVVLTLSTGQRGRCADGGRRRRRSGTGADRRAAPCPPRRRKRRGRRAPTGAIDEVAFALAYAGPGVRKLARELGVDLGE